MAGDRRPYINQRKMNDTIITGRTKRREILLACGCFLVAFLINVYSIIRYRTEWTEIFTQIGYVTIIATSIYAVTWVIRGCTVILRIIFRMYR